MQVTNTNHCHLKEIYVGRNYKKDLHWVFEKHTKNSDALNSNGSTCESFNLVVTSKAPKMYHYSQSESLDFHIALADCQKTISQTYINDVNTTIGLSPGKISHKFSSQQEKVKGSQQQLKEGVT